MTRTELLTSIIADLGSNYRNDDGVLGALLDEVIEDALRASNRIYKQSEGDLTILSSNIRRCVKTIYLQRGAEDVASQSLAGGSATFDDAMERMRKDIIGSGKRIFI